jgi:hypothetical protein
MTAAPLVGLAPILTAGLGRVNPCQTARCHQSNARDPPICADFGSMPVTTLAVQIRAFCASASRADGIAGYVLG